MKTIIFTMISIAILTGCTPKHGAGNMSDKDYNRQNKAAEKSLDSL